MTLRRAKILSSENDASVSQNTNINIRIAKSTGNIPQQPVNFTTPVCNTKFPTTPQETPELQSNQFTVQERDMGLSIADLANELEEKIGC